MLKGTLDKYECEFWVNSQMLDHMSMLTQTYKKAYEHNINLYNLYIDYQDAFDM